MWREKQAISRLDGKSAFVPRSRLSLSRQMIHLVINLISIVEVAGTINHSPFFRVSQLKKFLCHKFISPGPVDGER